MNQMPRMFTWREGALLVGSSMAVGALTGAAMATLLAIQKGSPQMLWTFILGGLLISVPIGALTGLLALCVGLGIQSLARRVIGGTSRLPSVLAMLGVATTGILIVSFVAIAVAIELLPFLWIGIVASVLGGLGVFIWSKRRPIAEVPNAE